MRSVEWGRGGAAVLAIAAAILSTTGTQAAVSISSQSTQNMSCSNGVCAPTAQTAVLNTGDLENLLASGNVTVTTTGSGVQAVGITVASALSWSAASALTLDAQQSLTIDAPISVVGLGGLTLEPHSQNVVLSFGTTGSVGFSNLTSPLVIKGAAYTLVGNIKTLAADIQSNPNGAYALAGTYDASADGTYTSSPIGTTFTGTFEGLGNTFLNLSVNDSIPGSVGLFAEIGATGVVRDLGLVNAAFVLPKQAGGGILTGFSMGAIGNCYATGRIKGAGSYRFGGSDVGGLVGQNDGTIAKSYAAASVSGVNDRAGGLVAVNEGVISQSHATGTVSGSTVGGLVGQNFNGKNTITGSYATDDVLVVPDQYGGGSGGGLVGYSFSPGKITNSYATGAVAGRNGRNIAVGGLVGNNADGIYHSYSTGAVTAGTGAYVGGLIGADRYQVNVATYWDTDKSGITNLSQGAGNVANDRGITGLSTAHFQAGLPHGFNPKIWAEKTNINGGLPYLLANPPAK